MNEHDSNDRRRRAFPTFGLIVLSLGILLLLHTTGVVEWSIWLDLVRFWPVLLIIVGLNILVGRRAPIIGAVLVLLVLAGSVGVAYAISRPSSDGPSVSTFSAPLNETQALELDISYGAGALVLESLPLSSQDLINAEFVNREARVTQRTTGDREYLQFSMGDGNFLRHLGNVRWDIGVAQTPSVKLDVGGGAVDMDLDLRELRVNDLDIRVGAADVRVILPSSAGNTKVNLSGGAADVTVVVPDGVAARVDTNFGLSSISVDSSRFPKNGDVHQSPDYHATENRVDIKVNVGAADVSIR